MKTLTTLLTAATLALGANPALAKDIGPDEALRLRDAGTIQSFEKLNEAAGQAPRRHHRGPNWKKSTAATSISLNCATTKVCNGIWSSTPRPAKC